VTTGLGGDDKDCKGADTFKSETDSKKGGVSSDTFGAEGGKGGQTADAFGRGADKWDNGKGSGKHADTFGSTGKRGNKAADRYDTGEKGNADNLEDTKEGGCRTTSSSESLSQLEKDGDCKTADNFKSNSKGKASADNYGHEGKCKNCSADRFEGYG